MAIFNTLLLTSAWAAMAAVADLTYPTTIEVDVLFPLNKTYNSNFTGIPVVLALQNAEAAYAWDWSIHWSIYVRNSSSDGPSIRGYSRSDAEDNEFQYHLDNVAIVPMSYGTVVTFGAGEWRLEWDYAATSCRLEGETSTSPTRTPIASGTQYYSIVEDGSGLDFDIQPGECAEFGDAFTIQSDDRCVVEKVDPDDGDACESKLTSADQMECIFNFLFSQDGNETETCLSSFEKADPDWRKFYSPSVGGEDSEDDDDSFDSDESDAPSDDNGPEDASICWRPSLSLSLTAVLLAALINV